MRPVEVLLKAAVCSSARVCARSAVVVGFPPSMVENSLVQASAMAVEVANGMPSWSWSSGIGRMKVFTFLDPVPALKGAAASQISTLAEVMFEVIVSAYALAPSAKAIRWRKV